MAALRRIASDGPRTELAKTLTAGRTVYQDAGNGQVERIEPDGKRTIGRLVNRHFTPQEPQRSTRRR